MNKNNATLLFLGACIVLAVLLLTDTITSPVAGLLFAGLLMLFGLLSRGFTRRSSTSGKQQ